MCRYDGLPVSAATVLRTLREEGLLLLPLAEIPQSC
jgi:hypothetical protein